MSRNIFIGAPRERGTARWSLAALAALLQLAGAPESRAAGTSIAPVTAEHRYRLSAAIRPLLFWVGKSNVGGARIVWRADGDGRRGYELLLGSDPARAPRRINRWGFAREDADPSGARTIGVMNRSEDDSLDQAKAGLGRGRDGYFFKMNRARVENGVARAEATALWAPEDYTFRQLDALQGFADAAQPTPRVRENRLPPGTHPSTEGELAEVPVFIRYQPKWWFRIEGVLDPKEPL